MPPARPAAAGHRCTTIATSTGDLRDEGRRLRPARHGGAAAGDAPYQVAVPHSRCWGQSISTAPTTMMLPSLRVVSMDGNPPRSRTRGGQSPVEHRLNCLRPRRPLCQRNTLQLQDVLHTGMLCFTVTDEDVFTANGHVPPIIMNLDIRLFFFHDEMSISHD